MTTMQTHMRISNMYAWLLIWCTLPLSLFVVVFLFPFCCSCWAHACATTLEAAVTRAGLTAEPLSPQWLIDCDTSNRGCSGGSPSVALATLRNRAISTESSYAYKARGMGFCANPVGDSGIRVKETGLATFCAASIDAESQLCNNPNEAELLAALKKYGPLAVIVDATNWMAYDGGIFPTEGCKHSWTSRQEQRTTG